MAQLSTHCAPNFVLHAAAGHTTSTLLPEEERLTALVAEGYSIVEIAALLALPETSVQALMAEVLRKLGFSDPLELILYSYSLEGRAAM
jgi:DNA-binding NarL/FixJ family response regulator